MRHTTIVKRIDAIGHDRKCAGERLGPIAGSLRRESLSIAAAAYIELVDWTGRQLRPDKRGKIAASEPAALSRLGLDGERWTLHVRGVGSGYWRAVGGVRELLEKATAMGQRWLWGIAAARAFEA